MQTSRHAAEEPSIVELEEELARRVDVVGNVPAHVVDGLVRDKCWRGRLVDVLRLFTSSDRRAAYLAGGRRPEEIVRSVVPWVEAPLSIGEIHLVVTCGGWDPEPFVPLAQAGLLERFLKTPGGTARRVHGELAGAWLSDECALADAREILELVRGVLADKEAPAHSAEGG